jgi:heme o synthase
MKTESGTEFLPHPQPMRAKASDFFELIKPKLTTLVLFSTAVGFCIGSQRSIRFGLLVHTLLGTALVAGGASALNMYAERDSDARMTRTALRPLAAGRIPSKAALFFAFGASAAGSVYLYFAVNHLVSLLSVIILAAYLFVYTPLKAKTWLCTLAGAVPGALPVVMGWSSANGALSPGAWVLFSILFFWQIPHFYSISWMHREDYLRAEFPVLSAIDASGRRTGRQTVIFIAVLIFCTLLPAFMGMSRSLYPAGAIVLGSIFLSYGIYFARRRDRLSARRLFVVSAFYLPALWMLILMDKFLAG